MRDDTASLHTADSHAAARAALWLRCIYPGHASVRVEGAAAEIKIGRGEDCELVVAGQGVSRQHAQLSFDEQGLTLRDLDSKNGTRLNGNKVSKAPVVAGDVIRVGGALLLLEASSVEPGAALEVLEGLWGGRSIQALAREVKRVATSPLPVVLQGETGTGKEVLAHALHRASGRPGKLVAVNCAALPESLAEAALFGHSRGAFTGADRSGLGFFAAAHRGTLFLDEVAELSLPLQAKLLRAVEAKQIVPVGESSAVAVDVRIVSAAQRGLHELVAEKLFRSDLYARLDGVTLTIPPLRERLGDVPSLFERFVSEAAGGVALPLEPALVERLCLWDWPLNVRELRQLAQRLVALHGHEEKLRESYLPPQFRTKTAARPPQRKSPEDPLHADRVRLLEALHATSGNVSKAAEHAGMSRQKAYRLLRDTPGFDLRGLRHDADS